MDTHQQSVQKVDSVVNYTPTISKQKFPITNQTLEYNLSSLNIIFVIFSTGLHTKIYTWNYSLIRNLENNISHLSITK